MFNGVCLQWCKSPLHNFPMVTPDFFIFIVKINLGDPKSRLREFSREVAQKAGEMRGILPSRREPERSAPRRPETRHRGTASLLTFGMRHIARLYGTTD